MRRPTRNPTRTQRWCAANWSPAVSQNEVSRLGPSLTPCTFAIPCGGLAQRRVRRVRRSGRRLSDRRRDLGGRHLGVRRLPANAWSRMVDAHGRALHSVGAAWHSRGTDCAVAIAWASVRSQHRRSNGVRRLGHRKCGVHVVAFNGALRRAMSPQREQGRDVASLACAAGSRASRAT